jgi:hypothetical protein
MRIWASWALFSLSHGTQARVCIGFENFEVWHH